MLVYHVAGSASEPYRVTFDGEGEKLRAYCTCPAGRRSASFCKHVAALLMGDVTALIEGGDDIDCLQKVSTNSPLLARALAHAPAPTKRVAIFDSPESAWASLRQQAEAKGIVVRDINPVDTWPDAAGLSLHRIGKHGKPLKAAAASIYHRISEPEPRQETVLTIAIDASAVCTFTTATREVPPRAPRPWHVTFAGKPPRSFGTLERALPCLIDWINSQ